MMKRAVGRCMVLILATTGGVLVPAVDAAAASKHTMLKPFFSQSLVGSETTKAFTARVPWQLAYNYNCGDTKGSFVLALIEVGGTKVRINPPTGISIGGIRAYKAGTYRLAATTTCKWRVRALAKR